MGSFTLIFFLTTLATITHAQNSPQDYLNAHNSARAQVGVGNMVWNATVAAYAQNYANQRIGDCNLVHSGGPYGENLAEGSGTFTGTARGCEFVCGHYTQVVWRNSIQLGCARVQCTNDGWWFIICSYYPPGNYAGQAPY
ncbi:putative CAP domain-containing protein [Helianthus debilis subsp. tardiflorus]